MVSKVKIISHEIIRYRLRKGVKCLPPFGRHCEDAIRSSSSKANEGSLSSGEFVVGLAVAPSILNDSSVEMAKGGAPSTALYQIFSIRTVILSNSFSKNLPGLKLVYKKYPNVDWYLMIDDDSYVMMDNLKMHLQKLDPNKKHYIGKMNRFKGCDGVSEYGTGPHFAQGGAGIVISRGAMVAMMENIDDCIVRY
ncbi:hypothetical protein HDU77_011167 [Chytriomyces hyalinus]|nr:hypothetical protein HDU77_011167 [Chytriomyces hyalinus]